MTKPKAKVDPKMSPKPKVKADPKYAKPKKYYDIGSPKYRKEVLLWMYLRSKKYEEKRGNRHGNEWGKISNEELLASGRIHEGRGSVVFTTEDIRIQKIISEELRSRHPDIIWWVFSNFGIGASAVMLEDFLE